MADRRRYDLAPLAAAAGLPLPALGRALGIHGSQWKQAREQGVGERAADHYAVRLGLHPIEVWPELVDHVIEAASIPCAGCPGTFAPRRSTQRYCTERCRLAAKARRRYRSSRDYRAQRVTYMVTYREEQAAAARKRRRRECVTRGCHVMFEPKRGDQRYHDDSCRNRSKMRRYREQRAAA